MVDPALRVRVLARERPAAANPVAEVRQADSVAPASRARAAPRSDRADALFGAAPFATPESFHSLFQSHLDPAGARGRARTGVFRPAAAVRRFMIKSPDWKVCVDD
jgi:hypothetical protein